MFKDKNKIHVAIIGGGLAGLSAAAALAEKGIPATIFEAGMQLGGRARSVSVEFNSQIVKVDNGQHILLGAYHETLKLLEKVGVPEELAFLRMPMSMNLVTQTGLSAFKLETSNPFPYPFNQLVGFLCCKGLSIKERISVVTFMLRLKQSGYTILHDKPLNRHLIKEQQSSNVIKLLWEPLCLAALNTPMHLASSKVFLNVLKDAFSSHKNSSDFLLPKLDLSQTLSIPIARYLNAKKIKVLLGHRVKEIKKSEQGFSVLARNELYEVTHVILATSAARLKKLVVDFPNLVSFTEQIDKFHYQPIYTVYLQYPSNTTLSKPMVGLIGTYSQWVFDRGILCGQNGLIAVIISAEGKHQALTQEALALKVAQELHYAFPNLVKPLWHKVIAEKRATFSCDVNLHRPTNLSPYPNLLIAGDYTYADYPSTIEGAVRSGISCVDYVMADLL